MNLKEKFANNRPIAVMSLNNWGGITILNINQDEAVTAYHFGEGYKTIRRNTIKYTTSGRPFFWKGKTRYYLDQFMAI